MANAINSLNYNSNTYVFTTPYGSCSTAAGTAAKTVSVDNFSLETGARVAVKFTVTNTAGSPTLNVNSTGAKAIYYNGAAITAGYLKANKVYEFIYNGTQWDFVGDIDTDTNTDTRVTAVGNHYTPAKSKTISASSTDAAIWGSTDMVTGIEMDAAGHVTGVTSIQMPANPNTDTNTTYSLSKDGSTIILTGSDGSTTSVTDADTNTVYTHPTTSGNKHIPSGGSSGQFLKWSADGTATWSADNNTKNTAGSTNTSSKIFLIGATSQAANPQTYSHDTAYVGDDGYLYSNSTKVNPRIYATLVPEGSAIPANADLNTVTYLKVGNYYCSSNATVKTLKNCPLTTYGSDGVGTNGSAFMMQVYSPLAQTFDDETTGTWRYRIRKIIHYNTGIEYTQYCYVGGTAGAANWVYGDWYVTPRSAFTFNKTAASTAAIGSATNPVYVDSTGTIQKTTYTLGKSVPSNAVFTDTDTHYTTRIYAGASGTAANAVATSPYIKITDDNTYRNQIRLVGSGATTVTSDANGNITISSTDNNTTYSAATQSAAGLMSAADKKKLDGVATGANNYTYTLPAATSSALGGVIVGSNITNSSGTISLTKDNVTAALGYTPPTSDTNTTYTFASGDSNGQIKVTPSGGTAQNVSVTGLAAAAYKAVADSTSASAIGTGTNLVTERDVYYGLPKINNSNSYTRSTTIYAPTAGGASGYVLVGAGTTTAPTWKTLANAGIAASGHNHDSTYLSLSGGTLTGELTGTSITTSGRITSGGNIVVPDGTSFASQSSGGDAKTLVFFSDNNVHLGSGSSSSDLCHTGDTYVNAGASGGADVYLRHAGGSIMWEYYSTTDIHGVFRPKTSQKAALGRSGALWYKVWAATSSIQTSDEREKSDIMAIADYPVTYSRDGSGNIWEKLFKKLVPKTYTLNIEESSQLNIGFVAQDVEKSMNELGLTTDDLALIDHSYWTDEETGEEKDSYGLSYEQFIALNTYMIQKQQTTIEEQQVQISTLEERIAQLEELVNSN